MLWLSFNYFAASNTLFYLSLTFLYEIIHFSQSESLNNTILQFGNIEHLNTSYELVTAALNTKACRRRRLMEDFTIDHNGSRRLFQT